jgi:hypothetical protein
MVVRSGLSAYLVLGACFSHGRPDLDDLNLSKPTVL